MDSLREECGELLGQKVNDENMIWMLDIVDKYGINSLNAACGSYLAEHFYDMLEATPERLYSLKVSTWAEMLKSDNLQIRLAFIFTLLSVLGVTLCLLWLYFGLTMALVSLFFVLPPTYSYC